MQMHVADAKRGKTSVSQSQLGFLCLELIGWKSGASFLSQPCSVVKQNQSLFDTETKTAL